MKKLRWALLIVLLAIIAIGVLLLSQQTALLPIIPNVIKPAPGGIYTEALLGSISRLNPVLDLQNSNDHDVDRLIYSGLIRFDDRGLPQGDLAESWGISLDGKVYNFSIRPKAVWQDGKPVTTDDVIFTIDLMRNEQSILSPDVRELWKQVEIKRLDDKTIQFRLPDPFAPFLDYLSFGVLPSHLLQGVTFADLVNSPFNLKPIGSGPYRFDHWITGNGQITGVVLKAFSNYYGQKPFIEQFIFKTYPDALAALAAYRNGDVMGISQVPQDILPEALDEPNLRIYTGRLPEMSLVLLNLNNPEVPFLQDSSVRHALLSGLNRQWMVDHLLDGQAIVADGPILPGTWAYYDGVEHVGFNPDDAIALLKKAGYTIPASGGSVRAKEDGSSPLKLELLFPDDPGHAALAEQIQRDWERLGVAATLKPVVYDQLVSDHLDPRTYQAALVDLNLMRSPDPDPYPFWHQAQADSGQNYSRWNDRQASEYLEQARVTTDLGERTKDYRNFQVRFSQELPALPLYYPVYSYAVDNAVQHVRMGPLFDLSDRFATVMDWFLLAKRATEPPATPLPGTPSTTP